MKIACTTCRHEMALDDSKLPPLPFKVKCTKCGTIIVVSNPESQPAQPASEATSPIAESIPVPSKIPPEIQEFIVQEVANIRKELFHSFQMLFGKDLNWQQTAGSGLDGSSGGRGSVLVCAPDAGVAGGIISALNSMGYSIEHLRTTADALKRLEEDSFDIVATNGNFPDDAEGGVKIIAKVNSRSSRLRRQIFLILITPQVKSADPKVAFFHGVNLTVNQSDIAQISGFVRDAMRHEQEQYQLYRRLSTGEMEPSS